MRGNGDYGGLHGLVLAAALLLSGCDALQGESRTVRLTTDAPLGARDEAVITARLNEHPSAYFPRYSYGRSGNTTTIVVRGGPSEEVLRFLLSRRGFMEATSESGGVWFSSADVLDAVPGFDAENRPVINLKLGEAGTRRLAERSGQGTGTILRILLDGEVIVAARLAGPVTGGMLQVSVNRPAKEVQLISHVLKSGALGAAPRSVEIGAPG
jgi:preprotein translocase subunit SecD